MIILLENANKSSSGSSETHGRRRRGSETPSDANGGPIKMTATQKLKQEEQFQRANDHGAGPSVPFGDRR